MRRNRDGRMAMKDRLREELERRRESVIRTRDFPRPRGAGSMARRNEGDIHVDIGSHNRSPGYRENGAKMRSEVYNFASAQRALERHGRKLGHNTTINEMASGAIEVWLYNTCIVTYYPDETIRLHSGGYRTVTTLSRINELLPPYLSVRGDGRGGWVVLEGVPRGSKPTAAQLKAGQPFFDGMRIGVR